MQWARRSIVELFELSPVFADLLRGLVESQTIATQRLALLLSSGLGQKLLPWCAKDKGKMEVKKGSFAQPVMVADFLRMTPEQFEHAMTTLLRSIGMNAETTQLSRDGGIDIWAFDATPLKQMRIIVQCKRYAPHVTVGEPEVRELFGLVHAHQVNKGVLISTSSFSPSAIRFADGKPLELIDGVTLVKLTNDAPDDIKLAFSGSDAGGIKLPQLEWAAVDAQIQRWELIAPRPYPLRIEKTTPSDMMEYLDSQVGLTDPSDDNYCGTLWACLAYFMCAYYLLADAQLQKGRSGFLKGPLRNKIEDLLALMRQKYGSDVGRLEDDYTDFWLAGLEKNGQSQWLKPIQSDGHIRSLVKGCPDSL